MENNNKESFKLLGMSASGTDSGSEVPEFVLAPPRKKRIKRRLRGTSASRARQAQSCNCQGRTIGLSLAAILLLCWLVTVSWLAIVLHGELRRLDIKVRNVVAGSQGVPDALQKCHSLSRGLQQNQTSMSNYLSNLNLRLENFSEQLAEVQAGLHDVEERLKAAPELVNLPQDVQSLSTSVASFGSQIRDLNTTVTVLKNENNQLQEASKTLVENVTALKQRVAQLVNSTQHLQTPTKENNAEKEEMQSVMKQLSANITLVNDTLNRKLQWVADDQDKDHKLFVGLQDKNQNVSARLTTLEGDCVKSESFDALNSTIGKILVQVNNGEKQQNDLVSQILQLQIQARQLESNGTLLAAEINSIHQEVYRLDHRMTSDLQADTQTYSQIPIQTTQGTESAGAGSSLHNPSNSGQ